MTEGVQNRDIPFISIDILLRTQVLKMTLKIKRKNDSFNDGNSKVVRFLLDTLNMPTDRQTHNR